MNYIFKFMMRCVRGKSLACVMMLSAAVFFFGCAGAQVRASVEISGSSSGTIKKDKDGEVKSRKKAKKKSRKKAEAKAKIGTGVPLERIRVLILNNVSRVTVSGAREGSRFDVVLKRGGRVTVNGSNRSLPLRFTQSGDFIYVNDKPYRGIIEVRASSKSLMVIDDVLIEEYLVGLINSEVSSSWHIEALKTQAVIARTYALYKKAELADTRLSPYYDLSSTNLHQVYSGAHKEDQKARRAVWKTRGQVLTYKGRPALTVYHSNAGGRTEASVDVWQSSYPYLKSVKSRYDRNTPAYAWELGISADKLEGKLRARGHSIARVKGVYIKKKSRTGRVKRIDIKGGGGVVISLSGEELRSILGYGTLRSTLFKVKKRGRKYVFSGYGSGHGVGLSQWGAKGMADKGYTYKKILYHYYPGTKLRKAY